MNTSAPVSQGDERADAAVAAKPHGDKARRVWAPALSVAGVVGLQIVGAVAGLAPLLAVVELARAILAPRPVDERYVGVIVLAGVGGLLLRLIFTGAATALSHWVDAGIQLRLRLRVASHLARVPLGWLVHRRTGELSKIAGDDVSALHPAIAHAPGQLVSAFVVPAVSAVYLFFVDWRMTLITLIPVAIAIALVPLMMTPSKLADQREFDAAMARIRNSIVELVRGITVYKAYSGQEGVNRRFRDTADEFVDVFRRWVRGMSVPAAGMQLALSPPLVILTVLLGGTILVMSGRLLAADVVPFLLLGLGLTAPVAALGHGFDDLQAARRAHGRIREVLRVAPLPVRGADVTPNGNRVEVRKVHFSYGDHEVLSGIDLSLEPGTTTAIVGPSGSGKSTLAQLLLRFADPTHGTVHLGGIDLRDLSAASLNRHIAAVLQDPQVLRMTVAENIAITVPDADEAAIIEAARLANIHDRIAALPHGYRSIVKEDVEFSGGEIQRIALARALLARAPVLVLDEATASADPLTERAVRHAVKATGQERTTVIIAHRLETIADADQVMVLEHGKVVEVGPPAQLRTHGGLFAELWQSSNINVPVGGDVR